MTARVWGHTEAIHDFKGLGIYHSRTKLHFFRISPTHMTSSDSKYTATTDELSDRLASIELEMEVLKKERAVLETKVSELTGSNDRLCDRIQEGYQRQGKLLQRILEIQTLRPDPLTLVDQPRVEISIASVYHKPPQSEFPIFDGSAAWIVPWLDELTVLATKIGTEQTGRSPFQVWTTIGQPPGGTCSNLVQKQLEGRTIQLVHGLSEGTLGTHART